MTTKVRSLTGVLSLFVLVEGLLHGYAGTFYWTNALGGLFSFPANWSPNSVPDLSDTAVFSNAASYVLTVNASRTNSSALFNQGSVTLTIPGGIWCLTNQWRVGEVVSNAASVTVTNGLLEVTNAAGTAVISVGRNWTGDLAVVGGSLATDFLQATNGRFSVLELAYGNLTTLHGVTVSNGTLVVGTDSTRPMVWNIIGGNNLILNDGFQDYGGLTLGQELGAGHAVMNLSGSNTIVSVLGLDVYGTNVINIRGGANLHTTYVQLGLEFKGQDNSVVISDPGSSWTNDYLMFFGMHVGGQTMIITNGGYFQTGGPEYDDEEFSALKYDGNSIIITGTNSWFNSKGVADFGVEWCSPPCRLNNFVLVENGGRFWARQLSYGSTNLYYGNPSSQGDLFDLADGSLWIGSLTFSVGALRVEHGTGVIDEMDMNGGSNAVLQVEGNLWMGQHGSINPGDLAVGGSNAVLDSLNGELQLGGWVIGASSGDIGSVRMIGGTASVANSAQIAASPGSAGILILDGLGTALSAPTLSVGNRGEVDVTNSASLRMSNCSLWGILDVSAGWASAGAPIAGATAGTLYVGSNGVVAGGGQIDGGVFVGSGGKMMADYGNGLLSINGDYQQAAGSTLSLELSGKTAGSEYGGLNVSGNVTLAGNLELDFVDGFAPRAGDAFQIVEYGNNAVGGFGTLQITGLGPGAQFSVQTNSAHVLVLTSLSNTVSTTLPQIFLNKSGSNWVVSWSSALTNFSLQATPSLSKPAWVDWNTVSNSYQFRATNNSQFFRLLRVD